MAIGQKHTGTILYLDKALHGDYPLLDQHERINHPVSVDLLWLCWFVHFAKQQVDAIRIESPHDISWPPSNRWHWRWKLNLRELERIQNQSKFCNHRHMVLAIRFLLAKMKKCMFDQKILLLNNYHDQHAGWSKIINLIRMLTPSNLASSAS